MYQQTVLRFCMSPRETFSNSITFTVINKSGKGAVLEIETVFRPNYHVACRGSSETRRFKNLSNHLFPRRFRHLSNHFFRSPYFGHTSGMNVIFFRKCSKFDVDLKNRQKN